jgi:hypothetical protein
MEHPVTDTQLADTANTVLLKILEYLEAGESFAQEQTPLLVQEVLDYNILISGTYVTIGAFLMIWAIVGFVWLYQIVAKKQSNAVFEGTLGMISGLAACIGPPVFFTYLPPLLKVLMAPRLFLLEYFRALIG